jgi:hypothetical protein
MTRLLPSAVLTVVLSATLSAELAAQSDDPNSRTNPACALLTEQELGDATGLRFGPGQAFDKVGQGVFGGATCLWGGVWNEDPAKSLPQIGVSFIPPRPRGSNTEYHLARKPDAGCTRETLRGVGDLAFADTCEGTLPSVRVYLKAGRNDVFLSVDMIDNRRPLSWAQPIALTLAKAAALKAKKA